MKRITGSKLSGKKMRVAAMFTGAAAAATTFTPAFAATAKASSLREAACTASRHTWLHIAYNGSNPNSTVLGCWGFKGGYLYYIPEPAFAECGGNNYGFLIWESNIYDLGYGKNKSVHFHQGTGYAYWPAGTSYTLLEGVHISGWAGTDKCVGT
jgi:hypothetical protein